MLNYAVILYEILCRTSSPPITAVIVHRPANNSPKSVEQNHLALGHNGKFSMLRRLRLLCLLQVLCKRTLRTIRPSIIHMHTFSRNFTGLNRWKSSSRRLSTSDCKVLWDSTVQLYRFPELHWSLWSIGCGRGTFREKLVWCLAWTWWFGRGVGINVYWLRNFPIALKPGALHVRCVHPVRFASDNRH